jgi:sulfite reductase alpha subunit
MENTDELKKGPWPSHVRELAETRYPLAIYEEALRRKQTMWTSGGYISAPGVPSGIIGRKSKRPDIIKESSALRVMPPPGVFFTSSLFRKLLRIAEDYGNGLIHLCATTSDIELMGIPGEKMLEAVKRIETIGLDVGSTDATLRTAKTCIGPARCDVALIDTLGIRSAFTERFLDDMQYPRFPHKMKTKIAGCPNDCVLGIHKSEIFICGTFKDAPVVEQSELQRWIKGGGDIEGIVSRCPGDAMSISDSGLRIDSDACIHCMYCINQCPSIRPGHERGASVLVGGKFRSKYGPTLARVVVPFMEAKPPEYRKLLDLVERIAEVFYEHARSKERLGEFLYRVGFDRFMELLGVEADPRNIIEPRENMFFHWKKEEL